MAVSPAARPQAAVPALPGRALEPDRPGAGRPEALSARLSPSCGARERWATRLTEPGWRAHGAVPLLHHLRPSGPARGGDPHLGGDQLADRLQCGEHPPSVGPPD